MLLVWGHALRTTALDPHICDQALSHSQSHPGHLFTIASSVCLPSTGASTPPKTCVLRPSPFPPSACREPRGWSSLSWVSPLPSLPFRKRNLKKLLPPSPIWGKLVQASQGADPPLPSRATQFELKIPVCLRKIQPQGVVLLLPYHR